MQSKNSFGKIQKILLTLFLFAFFLQSCEKKTNFKPFYQEENSLIFKERQVLETKEIKRFPLSGNSEYWSNSLGYSKTNNEEIFSFFNYVDQTIKIFDYKKQNLTQEIQLNEEGPHGVGYLGQVSGHFLVSSDSIFVYNINTGVLFQINKSSEIVSRFLLSNYEDPMNLPVPSVSTIRPIGKLGKYLFITCGLNNRKSDYSDYPIAIRIDLQSKDKNYIMTLPEIYNKAYWGGYFKYECAIAVNSNLSHMVFNFPIDPVLYKIDLRTHEKKQVFSGSKFFKEIRPFKENMDYWKTKNPNEKDIEEDKYSLTTPDFAGLLYDRFEGNYYRIAYLRPSEDDYQNGQRLPDFSLIILDQNLKKIGEKRFSSKQYDPSMIFISQDGVNLLRKDLYDENENFLSFEVFEIKEINNL